MYTERISIMRQTAIPSAAAQSGTPSNQPQKRRTSYTKGGGV